MTSVVFKQLTGWQHGDGGDSIYKELIEVPEMAAQQLVNSSFDWCNKFVPYSIGLNYSYLYMYSGDSVSNLVVIYPNTATAPITYASSDTAVATVDENGVVTGISGGIAYITIQCSGLSAAIQVRIGDGEVYGNLSFYQISESEYAVAAYNNNRPSGTLVIPSTLNGKNVVSVLDYGFAWCYDLNSVTIPSSILKIGKYAFGGSSSLKQVKFESYIPPEIGSDVFSGAWDYSDFKIMVPNEAVAAYKAVNANYWQGSAVGHIVGYNPDIE